MNVLFDTNVVLDVLLKREPWFVDAQGIWHASDEGRITGYLLASTFTDIFYIARRIVGREKAQQAVELCLDTFTVCPVNRLILEQALLMVGDDFEDNVQIAAANEARLDVIVTRNARDFSHASMPVVTPAALLAQLP